MIWVVKPTLISREKTRIVPGFIYSLVQKYFAQWTRKNKREVLTAERKSSSNLAWTEIDFRRLNASSTQPIITGIVTRSRSQQWSQQAFRDSHSKRFLAVDGEKRTTPKLSPSVDHDRPLIYTHTFAKVWFEVEPG